MAGKRKVVVIGLDGAAWGILRPRMADGGMPFLKEMAEAGATADLESIFPPETPAAWPSFATGKNPGKHGIFDFLVYNPETRTETPVNAGLQRGKAVWEYLSEAGLTSLVLNVPTTYPPTPIKGAMIAGFLTPAGARDFAYPKTMVDELEREFGPYPLFFKTMPFVTHGSAYNATKFLDELETMDATKFAVAEKLFDRYDPDFTMVHIWGTDRVQHELWSFIDTEHPKYDPKMAAAFGPRIDGYYSDLDACIRRLVEKAGEDAVTFVISDHGFGPTHYFIDLNSWLLREGFITLKKGPKVWLKRLLWNLNVTPASGMRVLAPVLKFLSRVRAASPEAALRKSTGGVKIPFMLSLDDVDWEKTRAYAPFGWSGIYVNTRGVRPNGVVDPRERAAVIEELRLRWAALENPYTGDPVGGPVYTNEEMFHGPYARYGPDLMPLPLAANYMPVCFFGFTSKSPVYENNTLFGNHRMEGILLALGKTIQPGKVTGARLIDMAPTILYLLGQPIPDDMDGQVIPGLIPPDELEDNPIQTCHVETSETVNEGGLTETEQEEIRRKLMGLGYL